jgi:hypothetical protein
MQVRIGERRDRYKGRPAAEQVIESAQAEIDGFMKCSGEVCYEFFIARASFFR